MGEGSIPFPEAPGQLGEGLPGAHRLHAILADHRSAQKLLAARFLLPSGSYDRRSASICSQA